MESLNQPALNSRILEQRCVTAVELYDIPSQEQLSELASVLNTIFDLRRDKSRAILLDGNVIEVRSREGSITYQVLADPVRAELRMQVV